MEKSKKRKSIFSTAILFAVMCVFALASCAPISEGSGDRKSGSGTRGGGAQITIYLPPLASLSIRALNEEQVSRLQRETRKYRVFFQTPSNSVVREGTGRMFSASFTVGTEINVTVECLNGNDEVIVRTVAKTLKVGAGENSLSFSLSKDGTELIPPTPDPQPTTVNITFEAGYYITNAAPQTWDAISDARAPQSGERNPGDVINETMSLNGFTFRGWVVKENYNPNATSYSQQQLITTYPNAASTLVGIWEENAPDTFTLSYSWGDGVSGVQGNLPSAQNNIASGTDVTVTIPTATRVGYDFLGWSETPNDQTATYTMNNTQIVITQDTVLYAVWSLKQYTLTLNPNYNDSGPTPSQQQPGVTVESTQALQILTRAGYTFAGYTASQNPQPNDTKYTTIAQLQADIRNGVIGTSGDTIELYAQWTPTSYNINYELDGGQNTPDAKSTYTIEDLPYILPTKPTKADSLFMGWYENSSFSGTEVTEIQQGSPGEKTFYAKWAYDIKMVSITGGTVPLTANYRPTVSNFRISDAEITQAQWYDVVGNKGYETEPNEGDDYPMHYVNWYDAIVFCNKLSIREDKTPCYTVAGKDSKDPSTWGNPPDQSGSATWDITCDWDADGYRLPTEAEWEYVGRAGNTQSASVYGNNAENQIITSNNIGDYAWHSGNAYNNSVHKVKSKSPNYYGLYDMSGNVAEWCWDWGGNNYDTNEVNDPHGVDKNASVGENRVSRGGSYDSEIAKCTVNRPSAVDVRATPEARYQNSGFRIVCRP